VRWEKQHRPPLQVHRHSGLFEQFPDVSIRPDVTVDAVIDIHKTIRLVIKDLGAVCAPYGVLHPLLEMRASIEPCWVRVFVDEVLQRGSGPPHVVCPAACCSRSSE
jgi:hypothetical protein